MKTVNIIALCLLAGFVVRAFPPGAQILLIVMFVAMCVGLKFYKGAKS